MTDEKPDLSDPLQQRQRALSRWDMLPHESPWFDSLCRLLFAQVFLRIFVKTELT